MTQLSKETDTNHEAHITHPAHEHSDAINLFGRTFSLPGGIYTFVYIALGIMTLMEVLIAETLRGVAVGSIALLVLSISKAALVMMFYMHLKDDGRFLTAIILLPISVTLLSLLYLIGIPPTGY
ncbi:hypothetical protein MASR2M15_15110 [Anaerolineales bacterium]